MNQAEHAIDVQFASKIYRGGVHALRGISLSVPRGAVFGLLGPNGAGKSTLVKILMTVVKPTEARGSMLGHALGHKPTLARVGYLPESHRFPRYLTGGQALDFFAALSGMNRTTRRRRIAELLEMVGMSAWADRRIGTYSKGMAQRLGLAQALAHDPELILLDEPTDGVDPVGRRDVRNLLLALRDRGKTVFINSHLLGELEMVCDRVAILVAGQVARQGTLDELTLSRQRYEIEVAGNGSLPQPELLDAIGRLLRVPRADDSAGAAPQLAGGQDVQVRPGVLSIAATDAADIQPVLDALRTAGWVIRRVQPMRPSLEALFIEALGLESGQSPPYGLPVHQLSGGAAR